MRRIKFVFLGGILLFWNIILTARNIDQIDVYDTNAEKAFFEGNLNQSLSTYQKALEEYWLYRDSTNIVDINERIRLVERLAVLLRETGNCALAVGYFKTCFRANSERKLIARLINKIIQCNDTPVEIDSTFKEEILGFFQLNKIDYAAHIQLNDLLSGSMPEEEELINFFFILEKGFSPAVKALDEQEKAQHNFTIMSFISFSTLFLTCIFGFILYILKKKKDFLQREKIALLEGKEKETDRLSVDLHDILGYKIVELKDQVNKLNHNIGAEAINHISQGLNELHESMRYIVQSNLTPESLKFGLAPALETLINRVNNLGVLKFSLYKYGLDKRLDSKKEKHIFYVIQELVNNIIKHSKGRNASIEITQSEQEVSIVAEDDGIGYQPTIDTLKTVKARITFLEGNVMEDSQEDQGATIILNIPI